MRRIFVPGRGSLQRRLLWSVSAAVAALWLLAAGWLAWDAHHELDELLDAHLAQSAALLVARQAADDGDEDDDDEALDAPVLHPYAHQVAFQVWVDGVLTLRSSNAPTVPLGRVPQGLDTHTLGRTAWRVFGAQSAVHGRVQVYVGEDHDARTDILLSLLRGLLGPWLLGWPLIVVAAAWLIRRGLAPLRELHDELVARDPHALTPLHPRDDAGVPAEIAPLRATLTGLFARIASLLDAERRFTADAAHELRTPIAAIRTQAQVALGATEAPERRHALLATLAGCDRANHLVQQLLTLSRLEAAGADGRQLPWVDVAGLAQRVAAGLAMAALDRQQTLSLDAEGACWVPGDEALLSVLLRNLVDNALRYSPPGAAVAVAVCPTPDGPVLSVDDSGPGLSADDLARLGERFFRVLGNGADGSGLGWSIVRRVAGVHGAQVTASRSALGGLRVTVAWSGGPRGPAHGADTPA